MDEKIDLNLDCYGLLGIDVSANSSDITKAYRQKALQVHPDKNPNSTPQLFHQVNQAYQILNNEKTRILYDKYLNSKKVQFEKIEKMSEMRKNFRDDLMEREKRAKLEKEQLEKEILEQLKKSKKSVIFDDLILRVKFINQGNLKNLKKNFNVQSIEIFGNTAILTFDSIRSKENFLGCEHGGIIFEAERKQKIIDLETLRKYEQTVFTKLRNCK